MIVLLSPAKNIDSKKQSKTEIYTIPNLLERAIIIADIMNGFAPSRLAELMKISKTLAFKNHDRFEKWEVPFTPENAKQAILTFSGEVYRGLNAGTFSPQQFNFAQNTIRILSGLYGVLRPLDLIMPYRLEMGTALSNPSGNNLYTFWKDTVTNCINDDLKKTKSLALINLASEEYFKVIDKSKITKPIITPVFMEASTPKPRVVAIHAKNARGRMAAFIIKNNLYEPEEIKLFDKDRYNFSTELSKGNVWVFIR